MLRPCRRPGARQAGRRDRRRRARARRDARNPAELGLPCVGRCLRGRCLVAGRRRKPPDLIISDYRLANGRSGIEAIELVRGALGTAPPAFLISGDTAPERLREASDRGYHLLHKPVPPMRLRAMLSQLLRSRQEGGPPAAAE